MPLPTSGPISMEQVAEMLGRPGQRISLDDADVRTLADKLNPNQTISLEDLYGAGFESEVRITPGQITYASGGPQYPNYGYRHPAMGLCEPIFYVNPDSEPEFVNVNGVGTIENGPVTVRGHTLLAFGDGRTGPTSGDWWQGLHMYLSGTVLPDTFDAVIIKNSAGVITRTYEASNFSSINYLDLSNTFVSCFNQNALPEPINIVTRISTAANRYGQDPLDLGLLAFPTDQDTYTMEFVWG